RMFQLEDSYWWFVGRHDLVEGFVAEICKGREGVTILDIGCGTGAMSKTLEKYGAVVSADFSPLALTFCGKRGLTYRCASDAMRLPFKAGAFDIVVAMDTLEHQPDDTAALEEIRRVLKPSGKVLATVPAYKSLWSAHDVALMHYRRYVAGQVRERFAAA